MAPKPGFVESVDPTMVDAPPSFAGWVHEVKWDGYRGQAHLEDGRAQLFTRAGNDWTRQFHSVAEAVARLDAASAILDGEVVALDEHGISDFDELRRQIGAPMPRLVYQVFDLLWLDGRDLRPLTLAERKARLKRLLAGAPASICYVDHLNGDGGQVLRTAGRLGLEGIVSKRLASPYRAGRSRDWLQVQCVITETFFVTGFSEDKATGRIDGLHLGRAGVGGTLAYAGKVENGVGEHVGELERRLRSLVQARPALPTPGDVRKPRWTMPAVLVEVVYSNKTSDGRIRHPSFKGFRDDLLP